jgi:pimeloyl-ACP methyl ester carboxylesterase
MSQAPDADASFAERRYTARDGLALYFRDYTPLDRSSKGGGDIHRPAVLCLPGLSRNSKDFHRPALRLQERGWRVICPDIRGRGRSPHDPNPDNYRIETYLDDVRNLLCAAGLHRVVVIGTSMGGILAMAMAAAMPTVLAGVVLNDVGAVVPAGPLKPIVESLGGDKTFASWDQAVFTMRHAFPDLPAETDEDWLELVQATFVEGPDGRIHRDWDPGIVKSLRDNPPGDTDLWRLFRALKGVPTGLVRGAKSDILSADIFDAMIRDRADLTHATVPGVGHPPNLREQPSKEVIDAVLARVSRV